MFFSCNGPFGRCSNVSGSQTKGLLQIGHGTHLAEAVLDAHFFQRRILLRSQNIRHCGSKAIENIVVFGRDDGAGFHRRAADRFPIQRLDREQIQDPCFDPLPVQQFSRPERLRHHNRTGRENRHIAALPQQGSLADLKFRACSVDRLGILPE